MTDATTQAIKTDGYHAHVCYESESRSRAQRLRERSQRNWASRREN